MVDLFTTGGAGAGGGLLGALLTFLGFKSRLDGVDKRIDNLNKTVTFKDTCDAKHEGINDRFDIQTKLLKEQRDDIKKILEKI